MNKNLYDVVIVGGGPAGLTAAIYLARAKYRVLVIEKEKFGGQITITAEVVNYPGNRKVSGSELTDTMLNQAKDFGAEFILAEVESLDVNGDIKKVHTSRGTFECFGVLLATGAHPRKIGFKGEEEFQGHGVAYCATCDGEFFTGKEVFVIGGGFAAAEEGVFLTKYAKHITLMMRGEDFTCAETVAEPARKNEKITILNNTEVVEVKGDNALRSITYKNRKTGQLTTFELNNDTFGVFVFAGYEPATSLVRGIAEIDEHGYVVTDRQQQTSVPGLYAAGDVCVKSLRQVVTATGDGALAATELERYAAAMQKKTGLHPEFKEVQPPMHKETPNQTESGDNELFTPEMLAQLNTVFNKMERPLKLKLFLDDSAVSKELEGYMNALSELTEKLSVEVNKASAEDMAPCVKVCLSDGTWTGLAFHGVPGGHEFTSFVLGLYNAAGPGQAIDDDANTKIGAINKPTKFTIMVSLSCTMCPELVVAVQRIAAANKNVTAEVFDINHYPDMREKYNVMSVPCMVINDEKVTFGKKNINQVLDLL